MSGLSCVARLAHIRCAEQTPQTRPRTEGWFPCRFLSPVARPKEESKGICLQGEHLGFEALAFHSLTDFLYLWATVPDPVDQHLFSLSQASALLHGVMKRREDSFTVEADFRTNVLLLPRGNFRVQITCNASDPPLFGVR